MEQCPLKQEIRGSVWARMAARIAGGDSLVNYLTLYSPPMMDIKHFEREGLLTYDGEKYAGVVAVTYNPKHYSEALRRSKGRPELMLHGDINQLLTAQRSSVAKQLQQAFPFQVINLDNQNALFPEQEARPLSEHLAAINEIARLQQLGRIGDFALFVTTLINRGAVADSFLSELATRVDENLEQNPEFTRSFREAYGDATGELLLRNRYQDFAPLGLVKLFSAVLALHSFEIDESAACVLSRDARPPEQWLLHLALRVKASTLPRARDLRSLGRPRQFYFERRVADFIERHAGQKLPWLRESADGARLQQVHGAYLAELASQRIDLGIPEPKPRAT